MTVYEHDSETATYSAALSMPTVNGVTISGVTVVSSAFVIPLTVTGYTGVNRHSKAGQIGIMPAVDPISNVAYGGVAASVGSDSELPKLSIEGFIDTPTETVSGDRLCSVSISSIRYTYADIIAMYIEGRINSSTSSGWHRVNPQWFRDPYGRVYNNPKFIDFSATYVEGVPGRTNVSMQLLV